MKTEWFLEPSWVFSYVLCHFCFYPTLKEEVNVLGLAASQSLDTSHLQRFVGRCGEHIQEIRAIVTSFLSWKSLGSDLLCSAKISDYKTQKHITLLETHYTAGQNGWKIMFPFKCCAFLKCFIFLSSIFKVFGFHSEQLLREFLSMSYPVAPKVFCNTERNDCCMSLVRFFWHRQKKKVNCNHGKLCNEAELYLIQL